LLIKCLSGGCPKTFVEEEIKMFIGHQLYLKYKKFKMNQLKLNNPSQNYINCPFPDCDDLIEITNLIKEDPFIQCELGHKFCAKCKTNGWHSQGKCNDVKIK
jgi:IBR domain, a half RING-finger domain